MKIYTHHESHSILCGVESSKDVFACQTRGISYVKRDIELCQSGSSRTVLLDAGSAGTASAKEHVQQIGRRLAGNGCSQNRASDGKLLQHFRDDF